MVLNSMTALQCRLYLFEVSLTVDGTASFQQTFISLIVLVTLTVKS